MLITLHDKTNVIAFNGKTYDIANTGYKIHLPVVPDSNDPLTQKIVTYLDNFFGTSVADRFDVTGSGEFMSKYFKVGSGGNLQDGKGITLYGKHGTMQEMRELANEIEQNFGNELADCVKKHNITYADPIELTNSVRARFSVYHHTPVDCLCPGEDAYRIFTGPYGIAGKCCAPRLEEFTTIFGEKKSGSRLGLLSDIDKKFLKGDSVMYSIDTFGELFSGKLENGKVPKLILESLPCEYRALHNLTDENIIIRINNGTRNIVAAMLQDIVEIPKSRILSVDSPWLTTLDTKVIDGAKQLLAQHEPETVQKLEQMLPQLTRKCPALSILNNSAPLAKSQLAKELDFANAVKNIVKNAPVFKTGLCVAGAFALVGVATSIFAQSDNKEFIAKNQPARQTTTYSNCLSLSKGNMTI